MNKRTITASTIDKATKSFKAVIWPWVCEQINAGRKITISAEPEKRSDTQNRRLWAMLHDISQQVEWFGRKMDSESWKNVFSAAVQQQDVVPDLSGGFVVLGVSTRKQSKAWFNDMFLIMESFGAEKGVKFRDVNYLDYPESGI